MSMTPIQRVEVLRAACCVAGADGVTDAQELELLKKLAEGVGVGQASLTAMIARAESDEKFCNEQFLFLKENPSECMAILLQVASVNNKVDEREQQVLKKLADNLGVSDEIFSQLVATTKSVVSE